MFRMSPLLKYTSGRQLRFIAGNALTDAMLAYSRCEPCYQSCYELCKKRVYVKVMFASIASIASIGSMFDIKCHKLNTNYKT